VNRKYGFGVNFNKNDSTKTTTNSKKGSYLNYGMGLRNPGTEFRKKTGFLRNYFYFFYKKKRKRGKIQFLVIG
jgi:hypothetical protein